MKQDSEFATPARSLYEMSGSEESQMNMGTPARNLYDMRTSGSLPQPQMMSPFTPCRITLAQVLLQMRTHQVPLANGNKSKPRKHRTSRHKADSQLKVSVSANIGGKINPRKRQSPRDDGPCNCKKSRCLKLYCQCFAGGRMCNDCKCNNCLNTPATPLEREEALRILLEKNPTAFDSKIGIDPQTGKQATHRIGCRCKKSACQKNYCECFQAGVKCAPHCSCVGCKNCDNGKDSSCMETDILDGSSKISDEEKAASLLIQAACEDLPSSPTKRTRVHVSSPTPMVRQVKVEA